MYVTNFVGESSDDEGIPKSGVPDIIKVQEYQPGITDGVPNKHLVEKDRLRGIRAMKRKEAQFAMPSSGIRRF